MKSYEKLAVQTVESLWDGHMDLDRFLPELHREILGRAKQVNASPEDYNDEDLTYWANQERESLLFLEGLDDAITQLYCVDRYALPRDDQVSLAHVRRAIATLQNMKRRMEVTAGGTK